VIWATGFSPDLRWLAPSLLEREGLHVLGRAWLRSRKSGMVYGAAEDSAAIVARITGGRAVEMGRRRLAHQAPAAEHAVQQPQLVA